MVLKDALAYLTSYAQVDEMREYSTTELMHRCEFVVGFSRDGIHIMKDRNAERGNVSFQEFLQRLADYSSYLAPIKSFEPLIKYIEKKTNSLKCFL